MKTSKARPKSIAKKTAKKVLQKPKRQTSPILTKTSFYRRLDSLLGNSKRRRRLLILEKQNRKVDNAQVVFLGARNVADYGWCAMQSIFKSREREPIFFASYLGDRLKAAFLLGLLKNWPETDEDILEVGEGLTLLQAEKALSHHSLIPLNESTPADPMAYGIWSEQNHDIGLPSFRWHLSWSRYVIEAVPDGIGLDHVHEHKAVGSDFLLAFTKPVFRAQANLYCMIFKRPRWEATVELKSTGELLHFQEEFDKKGTLELLRLFEKADAGELPRPPRKWKCKNCEYSVGCPVKP